MVTLKQKQGTLRLLLNQLFDGYELTKQEIDILWVIQNTIVERIVENTKK